MEPLVKSGAEVTLQPLMQAPKPGDIVLVRVSGNVYLHLVKAVEAQRFQIGNNRGHINGWVGAKAIYGLATKINNQR